MEDKIPGFNENGKGNDGFFCNSPFIPSKNAMGFYNVVINGETIKGVVLPDNVLKYVIALYEELKEKNYQQKLNQDIKFRVNDMETYGIYNGICKFDIGVIVYEIKKQHNCSAHISDERIAYILSRDEELKQTALDTYQPDPENTSWREEYMKWFRKAAATKEAPGYGIIPNELIKSKISSIILSKEEEVNRKRANENVIMEEAKLTGIKQVLSRSMEKCDGTTVDCSFDTVTIYAMPDGTKKTVRNHCY